MSLIITVAVSGILDLPEGEEVVVAGTAYKEMKLKVRRCLVCGSPHCGVGSCCGGTATAAGVVCCEGCAALTSLLACHIPTQHLLRLQSRTCLLS